MNKGEQAIHDFFNEEGVVPFIEEMQILFPAPAEVFKLGTDMFDISTPNTRGNLGSRSFWFDFSSREKVIISLKDNGEIIKRKIMNSAMETISLKAKLLNYVHSGISTVPEFKEW